MTRSAGLPTVICRQAVYEAAGHLARARLSGGTPVTVGRRPDPAMTANTGDGQVDPALAEPRAHLANGGQRVGTFVIYLSDVEAGGCTVFPALGLEVRPKKGSAVFFANVDADGTPDRKTLHGGQVMTRGVRDIATTWLRESVYGTAQAPG